MKRGLCALAAGLALVLVTAAGALAGSGNGNGPKPDTREPGKGVQRGHKPVQPGKPTPPTLSAAAQAAASTGETPPLGTQKLWLSLDEVSGRYFFTTFTLRGVGGNVEVWVQNNLSFQAGDCRNGDRTTITDAQVAYLIDQFDGNIYPKESQAFSVPPQRDGSDAILPGLVGLPADYYAGKSDNIVVLVSNVRDSNYYDLNNAHQNTYIAGFFSSQLNAYFGRNVMSIDAFDWLHRTGAEPPDNPVPGDPCTSAPARPFLYEGTFAHEYQHLLESYESPGERSWVNEGLSDFAIDLTGYGDPGLPITDRGFQSHVQCFLGWLGVPTPVNPNPRENSGPENSLTLWGDQGDGEILCDYGAAWTFMEYLYGRFGLDFLSALHDQDLNGLAGLQATLDQFRTGETALGVIHQWAAMVAVDAALESSSARGSASDLLFSTPDLHAAINWDTPEAYSTPGAPPNGSDYVQLRDATGQPLGAGAISSLSFQGSKTLEPDPIQWVPDDGALYSGTGDELDRSIVRSVDVPSSNATLSFTTRWNLEEHWDFAFVQVSTDGGKTYQSVTCDDSRSDADPEAYPTIAPNLPGFTGLQDWKVETCDLSGYAGKTVYLAFRLITDWATQGNEGASFDPGFWVKDVEIGGTPVASGATLDGWQSPTEVRPVAVYGWTVQLVGIDTDRKTPVVVAQVPVGTDFTATLDRGRLQRLIGDQADVVGAIVTYDEPTELITKYAQYTLKVNGVTQPGGS